VDPPKAKLTMQELTLRQLFDAQHHYRGQAAWALGPMQQRTRTGSPGIARHRGRGGWPDRV
jgi:hypothetical protein